MGTKTKSTIAAIATVIAVGFLLPEDQIIPVEGASSNDWNHNTFWYEPWGKSGVHKGIDIFSSSGTPVISSSYGIVVYSGFVSQGGNVVLALGPKWKLHYYAHLNTTHARTGSFVNTSDSIGTVGDTGNAKGKPIHLHYSIVSLIPRIWRIDSSTQGWKKMFYLNPSAILKNN